MLASIFILALRSVQRNMLRSFLTILGIVIGVGAVITMVTLGNGATQAIKTQITSLGTNLLIISPGQRVGGGGGGGGVPQFTEADADAILAQIGGVAAVAPQGRANVTVVANGRNWVTSVTMVMTAPTPMTIPRMVKKERNMLRCTERKARIKMLASIRPSR